MNKLPDIPVNDKKATRKTARRIILRESSETVWSSPALVKNKKHCENKAVQSTLGLMRARWTV